MASDLFQIIAVYETILLGRCAFASLVLLLAVRVLRRTLLRNATFAKGLLWGLFLLIPFTGRFYFYYEPLFGGSQPLIVKNPFAWWHIVVSNYPVIAYLYFVGIAVSLGVLGLRYARLRRLVRHMEKTSVCGETVCVTEESISPFTTGLLHPEIIVPRAALDQLSESELRTILLHERTHIRLRHLWIFAGWELLSAVLWLNPFLVLSLSALNQDMERICDRVTIQRSGMDAVCYGRLILKSVTLLQSDVTLSPAAFAGERSFLVLKERFRSVRDFSPYRAKRVAALLGFGVAALTLLLTGIHRASYPKYTEMTELTITDETGNYLLESDLSELSEIVTLSKHTLTITDSAAFKERLTAQLEGDGYYYFYCDGYYKLPGVGGGVDCYWVETLPESGSVVATYGEPDLRSKLINRFFMWL